ncbi:hypothetical protein [Marinobacter nauticus]|uniref:hypothetical protein n=1 Tax=Marinobacter nauticus TaxID=2743 RepID=UPI0037368600
MKLPVFASTAANEPLGYLDTERALLGLSEAQTYLIGIPDQNARCYVDDALLNVDDSGQHWVWEPGFFAGEVGLELELPELAHPIRYRVDVSPAPHKSGRDQFNQYLQQIIDFMPQLATGTEPAMHNVSGRSGFVSLWLRYARLRQFIDRYLTGLRAIQDRPIVRLSSRREQMPLHMAKRIDGITVQRLTANAALLSALSGDLDAEPPLAPEQCNLDVPFHEPSMDNPANRLMARQLIEVRRLARSMLSELRDLRVSGSETETDLKERLPRRIRFLKSVDKKLERIERGEPFASASVEKRGVADLNAVSGHPHYNMTYRAGIRILRQGLSDMGGDEQHYLAPTWEIYEVWCFVAFAEALQSRYPDYEWQLEQSPVSADLILRGQSGSKRITLFFQTTCPSLEKPNRYGYFSVSKERRPDMLLEIVDGDQKRYICLDSKYTASKSRILDSMASAHIYRDCLRCGDAAPVLSIILVPANDELSALGSVNYWSRNGVGSAILATKEDIPEVTNALLSFAT